MKKTFLFCVLILLASVAWATPANMAVLDGKPIEYDSTDLRGSFVGASTMGDSGTLTNLFVTWDSNYVYIALQGWKANTNKLVVLLDVDPGAGTGATTATNWTGIEPSFIKYNDYGWVNSGTFGLDYMLASEGTYNNAIRVNYDGVAAPTTNNLDSLFDAGNGATPSGTPLDMAALSDASACPLKGFEARIPWSVLYSTNRFGTVETNEIVPRGASLRFLAGINNNNPDIAWSSPDTIPNQAVEDYTNGIVTTATYLDVLLDTDTNGIPDMLFGDVNAPYIRDATGAAGGSSILVGFNEPVLNADDVNLWTVGGVAPISAIVQSSQVVLLGLASPIADTNLVAIRASGVMDTAANSRISDYCLFPAASGIPQSVTLTFVVATNSGMGISSTHSRPTGFFVNGSSLPLEWGDPPFDTLQLTAIPTSNGWTTASVTFPAGSPTELWYKYSGRIDGTNNYEAITLANFADSARPLTLNTNGTPQTVIDYLGAAAYPLRNPADTNLPTAHNRLYNDPQRGDAGVRVRREILFQLDLSLRERDNLARVFVAGSDPLRGFNDTGAGTPESKDYPGPAYVAWTNAGVQLFDDGSHGDTSADDGIYARLWTFSTDGADTTIEPDLPYSLVGGRMGSSYPVVIPGTEPYFGYGWATLRSPRSLIYKFYAFSDAGQDYESPGSDIEYYVIDPEETAQIVLNPFLWIDTGDGPYLPLPPPSNAPTLTGVLYTGATPVVEFENVLTEASHGVRVSSNVLENVEGYADYGTRASMVSTNGGMRQWSAGIPYASDVKEFYTAYAGVEPDPLSYWEPSYLPATALTWRIYFSQYKGKFAGYRTMSISGNFNGWVETPMVFLGSGLWATDIDLAAATDGELLEYKFRSGDTWADDPNNKIMRGGPVTWTPDQPAPEDLFSITLDVTGTAIATATNINAHLGYPPDAWSDLPMTNTSGAIWEYATVIPSNAATRVSWVFNAQTNGSDAVIWIHPDDIFSGGTTDPNWHAFLSTLVNP